MTSVTRRRLEEAADQARRDLAELDEQQSTGEYLRNLLRRAEEFGIHRDNQIAKAIDVLMEICVILYHEKP